MNFVLYAFFAGLFTYGVTALGSALVIFFKAFNEKVLKLMMGFAGGVMIAASFWSLLAPAIEFAEEGAIPAYLAVAIGFLGGGLFLWGCDKILDKRINSLMKDTSDKSRVVKQSVLLVLAITLHNIPEGLAVGVGFGMCGIEFSPKALSAAISVAIGIGIQNFPEGAAVSIPLRRAGLSRGKSFLIGQASAIVEPIFSVLGALLVMAIRPVLPYALSFAAGCMIFVVAKEIIVSAVGGEHGKINLGVAGVMLGFTVMMILDVALG